MSHNQKRLSYSGVEWLRWVTRKVYSSLIMWVCIIIYLKYQILVGLECTSNGLIWWLDWRRTLITRVYWFLHKVLHYINAQAWKVALTSAAEVVSYVLVLFSSSYSSIKCRYEIKFLVDGEWKLSPEFPTIGEGLTENNLLIVE